MDFYLVMLANVLCFLKLGIEEKNWLHGFSVDGQKAQEILNDSFKNMGLEQNECEV